MATWFRWSGGAFRMDLVVSWILHPQIEAIQKFGFAAVPERVVVSLLQQKRSLTPTLFEPDAARFVEEWEAFAKGGE